MFEIMFLLSKLKIFPYCATWMRFTEKYSISHLRDQGPEKRSQQVGPKTLFYSNEINVILDKCCSSVVIKLESIFAQAPYNNI